MSVWTDHRLIEVSKKFIPAADEVWRLQRSTEPDAILFQNMANQGHYQHKGGTRQGIYICSADGTFLSSINSLNPDEVLETIEYGLNKWEFLPQENKKGQDLPNINTTHRWENSYPAHGLVLTSVNTDLISDPPILVERSERRNIDHVWIHETEVASLLPEEPKVGINYSVPEFIKNRLFCFHLVDNVRGQTLPFAPQEIKQAEISLTVTDLQGSMLKLQIFGHSDARADGDWLLGQNDWTPSYSLNHGMKTQLMGNAIFDLKINKFTEFEMVAIGKRYGKTELNSREFSPDTSYLGFYFSLAGEKDADKIAPAFVDIYNVEWIEKP